MHYGNSKIETQINRYKQVLFRSSINRYRSSINRYRSSINRYRSSINRYRSSINRYRSSINRYRSSINRYRSSSRSSRYCSNNSRNTNGDSLKRNFQFDNRTLENYVSVIWLKIRILTVKIKFVYSHVNSQRFSEDKQDICNLLMLNSANHCPVLCNQNFFLLQGNRLKIKQCLLNARIFYKKAIKDFLEGRPKNGMFIAVVKEIQEHASDVSPKHWRVPAIILKAYNNRILIINSYFPTDPRAADFDTTEL